MGSHQIVRKSNLLPTLATQEEKEIVQHCENLRGDCHDNRRTETRVDQYKNYAVKSGKVSVEEAENQLYACENLDPTIVKVPQIHSYFTVAGLDYLIMQFIPANTSTNNCDEDSVNDCARIVVHLHSIVSERPGPLIGGENCRSMLWPDGVMPIASRKDLETTISKRLKNEKFHIGESPLVLNHGDLRPSNFINSPSGWYLCDWEYASFLPRTAEIASLQRDFATTDEELSAKLRLVDEIQRLKPLNSEESLQVDIFLVYAFNIVAYAPPCGSRLTQREKREKRHIVKMP
ncbi:hypothetical protein KC356_g9182 [Hortaea werneckii]|nr:hypothetical protein KC356_g9182 [Hortaea werneckii]